MDPPHAPPLSTAAPSLTTSPPTTTTTIPTTLPQPYTDSIDSSPHSRATDFDDAPPTTTTTPKLRLMCSYGGHIVPRPHTKSLCYVGGDTRMVVVDRTSTLSDLLNRLSKTLSTTPHHHHHQKPFTLKYQLPNEDLDSLITVSTDEDLDNMIDEYDRLNSIGGKPGRIRLFLFPVRPEGAQSMGPILDGSNRSEDWFLNALNGGTSDLHRGFSDPNSVNCLLGLDHDVEIVNPNYSTLGSDGNSNNNSNHNSNNNSNNHINSNINNGGNNNGGNLKGEMVMEGLGGKKLGNLSAQDVQSVPDSPIVETTSSFGSTSSSPSLGNLPQIRVHADEGSGRGVDPRAGGGSGGGIEEQFAQFGVGGGGGNGGGGTQVQKVIEEGFMVISSPPSVAVGGGGGEFGSRVYVDDVGFAKQQQQQQQQMGQGVMSLHAQQKQQLGGSELPSPDSISSDSSLSGAIARQKPVMYQDTNGQLSSGSNMFPQGIQVHQVPESGYTLLPQSDQVRQIIAQQHQNQQFLQQYHPQQQPQTQPQTQPQYIPAGQHFVHHHPPGAVPLPTYYQVYPSQQQHNHPHQYPVYYVPAGPAQGYSLPGQQQPNLVEAPTSVPSNRTQAPPNPTIIPNSTYNPTRNMNLQPLNSELGPAVYGTTTGGGGPQLVQVPSSLHQPSSQSQSQLQPQHQYVGYSQIHHPSQSVAPSTGTGSTYAYEFADPAHPQVFYTQPLAPVSASTPASQYQGMTSAGPTMMMPEGASQLSNDSAKQQT